METDKKVVGTNAFLMPTVYDEAITGGRRANDSLQQQPRDVLLGGLPREEMPSNASCNTTEPSEIGGPATPGPPSLQGHPLTSSANPVRTATVFAPHATAVGTVQKPRLLGQRFAGSVQSTSSAPLSPDRSVEITTKASGNTKMLSVPRIVTSDAANISPPSFTPFPSLSVAGSHHSTAQLEQENTEIPPHHNGKHGDDSVADLPKMTSEGYVPNATDDPAGEEEVASILPEKFAPNDVGTQDAKPTISFSQVGSITLPATECPDVAANGTLPKPPYCEEEQGIYGRETPVDDAYMDESTAADVQGSHESELLVPMAVASEVEPNEANVAECVQLALSQGDRLPATAADALELPAPAISHAIASSSPQHSQDIPVSNQSLDSMHEDGRIGKDASPVDTFGTNTSDSSTTTEINLELSTALVIAEVQIQDQVLDQPEMRVSETPLPLETGDITLDRIAEFNAEENGRTVTSAPFNFISSFSDAIASLPSSPPRTKDKGSSESVSAQRMTPVVHIVDDSSGASGLAAISTSTTGTEPVLLSANMNDSCSSSSDALVVALSTGGLNDNLLRAETGFDLLPCDTQLVQNSTARDFDVLMGTEDLDQSPVDVPCAAEESQTINIKSTANDTKAGRVDEAMNTSEELAAKPLTADILVASPSEPVATDELAIVHTTAVENRQSRDNTYATANTLCSPAFQPLHFYNESANSILDLAVPDGSCRLSSPGLDDTPDSNSARTDQSTAMGIQFSELAPSPADPIRGPNVLIGEGALNRPPVHLSLPYALSAGKSQTIDVESTLADARDGAVHEGSYQIIENQEPSVTVAPLLEPNTADELSLFQTIEVDKQTLDVSEADPSIDVALVVHNVRAGGVPPGIPFHGTPSLSLMQTELSQALISQTASSPADSLLLSGISALPVEDFGLRPHLDYPGVLNDFSVTAITIPTTAQVSETTETSAAELPGSRDELVDEFAPLDTRMAPLTGETQTLSDQKKHSITLEKDQQDAKIEPVAGETGTGTQDLTQPATFLDSSTPVNPPDGTASEPTSPDTCCAPSVGGIQMLLDDQQLSPSLEEVIQDIGMKSNPAHTETTMLYVSQPANLLELSDVMEAFEGTPSGTAEDSVSVTGEPNDNDVVYGLNSAQFKERWTADDSTAFPHDSLECNTQANSLPSSRPGSQASKAGEFCLAGRAPSLADDHVVEERRNVTSDAANVLSQTAQNVEIVCDPFDDDDPVLHSSPLSSQPRFSSPDRVFSSPPPGDFSSPPSSPPLMSLVDEKDMEMKIELAPLDDSPPTVLGKRPRSPTFPPQDHSDEREDHGNFERVVGPSLLWHSRSEDLAVEQENRSPSPNLPPRPMRPTAASLKSQFKKLSKPFRSPLVKAEDILAGKEGIYASAHMYPSKLRCTEALALKIEDGERVEETSVAKETDDGNAKIPPPSKPYSARVAKQFKSPLAAPSSQSQAGGSLDAASKSIFSSVKPTPTIQVLQAKVQKLKQAIKIKGEQERGDEQKLETLVSKWRSVGRDVAWLVWDTVKDLDPGEGLRATPAKGWDDDDNGVYDSKGKAQGKKHTGFDGGWGFQGDWGYDDEKKPGLGGFDKSWGWDDQAKATECQAEEGRDDMEIDRDKEQSSQPHSLGTMLRHLGIDPETLGWDEDEGDFVGDP